MYLTFKSPVTKYKEKQSLYTNAKVENIYLKDYKKLSENTPYF